MNLYRLLAYLLILSVLVLGATLVEMLMAVGGGATLSAELRKAIVILIVVIVFAILIILMLLCLARAKDRLGKEKALYREAHGANQDARTRGKKELSDLLGRRLTGLQSICDVLVRRKFPRPCLQIPIDVTRRPDPCIYSQFYLMANNQPVTWDNPNIEVLLGGLAQDTYNLQASTNYQIKVGIENASPFFDARGTQVQVNLLDWGMGMQTSAPLHSYVLDVPAGTALPGVPHTFNWTSPAVPTGQTKHYCIQVLITHPQDVNPDNNHGWNNTDVHGIQAGQAFMLKVPLWNAVKFDRKTGGEAWAKILSDVRLTVDSYELPRAALPARAADALFTQRPALWNARVTPNQLTVTPGNRAPNDVEFAVTVPGDVQPGTRGTFNISATAGGRPIGGVTIHLDVR
jgi:hypothetical protein